MHAIVVEEVGKRKARKPTHKCPGCGAVGIGKRPAPCVRCEAKRLESEVVRMCAECPEPISGHANKIYCDECMADRKLEQARLCARERRAKFGQPNRNQYDRKWRAGKGKQTEKRYAQSDAGKARAKRWTQKPENAARRKAYSKKNWQDRGRAKRLQAKADREAGAALAI